MYLESATATLSLGLFRALPTAISLLKLWCMLPERSVKASKVNVRILIFIHLLESQVFMPISLLEGRIPTSIVISWQLQHQE